MTQAQNFLSKGEQVQIRVQLRGRQKSRPQVALDFLNSTVEEWLTGHGRPTGQPTTERLQVTFNPKKK